MRLKSLISRQGTAFAIPEMFNLIVNNLMSLCETRVLFCLTGNMILLLPSCFSSKAEWAGWQPQGSFVQRVQSPPQGPHRVHTGSTPPLFYAALTYTKAHVAMCDRALGGFPWLLISILTPLSRFLCGNKSHTKVHMWIYSWVRQEIRNLLTFYWDIYLKLIVEKHNGMCW